MPRIVLPITSRGLVVNDRICWVILGGAMAVAAGLILYLNRGTIFYIDELALVHRSPSFDAGDLIDPYNGHLAITTRVVYKAILETIGADYLAFRLLHASMILVAAGLFYALVKRRIGALPALAPALVLLFFGSASGHVVIPQGFGIFFCVAAGLGALLALERDDRRGDVAACVLLCLAIVTFSTGLAFLVGVAISVLMRHDRFRRAWIFLIPLVLYAAWWLWALSAPASAEQSTKLSNVLLIPGWFAESLAAVAGALAGLNYDFANEYAISTANPKWGYVLGALAVLALALRIRRRNVPPSLWASLGILLSFWALGALAFVPVLRAPGSDRYIYMGAVGALLVATAAARGVRFSKLGLAALFGACAISLATNVALLRDGGAFFRSSYSIPLRSQLTVLELARGHVDPGFAGVKVLGTFGNVAPAGPYLEAVDRYGSLGLSLAELERQSATVREDADQVLASALELRLRPSPSPEAAGRCRRFRAGSQDSPAAFELPVGGATIRARATAPGKVAVGRFASAPTAEVGSLSPGETATLRIPPDSSPSPWHASVAGAKSVQVCAPG